MPSCARSVSCALALSLSLAAASAAKPTLRPSAPVGSPAPRATAIAGEDIASAIVIPSLPFSVSSTTCGYLDDGYPTLCGLYPGPDVVYAFAPATDMHVEATLCPVDLDYILYVMEDGPGTTIACGYYPCDAQSRLYALLRAGHTYYFVVDRSLASGCGAFTLSVAQQPEPPAGQTMADAIPIPALPFSTNASTAGYGVDYRLDCTAPGSPDVVYSFTPTSPMCVDISMCDSGYDTSVGVYQDLDGPLIACNDDSCPVANLSSHLEAVALLPGHTYFIVVTGFGGEFGPYVLNLAECGVTASRRLTWGGLKSHYR